MPYGRIDDTLYDNDKAERTSLAGLGAVMLSISYAGRHMTDGVIPDHFVQRHITYRPQGRKALKELLERGWFHRAGDLCSRCLSALSEAGRNAPSDGFYLHDYLEHNDSKERIQQRRETNRQRQACKRRRDVTRDEGLESRVTTSAHSGIGQEREEDKATLEANGEIDAGARNWSSLRPGRLGEVLEILDGAQRFCIDPETTPAGVQQAIDAYPNKDPVLAARQAVAWVSDPNFRMTGPAAVLLAALKKQWDGVRAQTGPQQNATAYDHGEKPCRCGSRFRRNDPARRHANAGLCDQCQDVLEAKIFGDES
jgi:hypothetical protein